MEIFFNELSTKIASNDAEAKEWLTKLAELGQFLKRITNSLDDNTFQFRRKEDFGEMNITANQKIREFLFDENHFDYSDSVAIFLMGIFDTPYITADDPKHTIYDNSYLSFEGNNYDNTGIVAAYLKNSLVISFDNHVIWDTHSFNGAVTWLNEKAQESKEQITVKHASKIQHIDYHLDYLANLFDWETYKPNFNPSHKQTTLLPLLNIYSLYLGDGQPKEVWEKFYKDIAAMNNEDSKAKILEIAKHIAKVQKWEEATASLKSKNTSRTLYMIPNSDFIVSIDKQHGDLEVCKNEKPPNHYGSVSFDGLRFKEGKNDHSIVI